MMQFGFRWVSLGNLTEVQSMFPVEQAQDGTRAAPFLSGIARMRHGDTWNADIGIAVAMVRFRHNGRYNRQELRLADSLRKRATEKLPSSCWGDFFLSLGAFLEVLRIRSEFRTALAVEAVRDVESARWLDYILTSPMGDLLYPEADSADPMERALAAIREVGGVPVSVGSLPIRKALTESAIAESCARRILKATGPFVQPKRLATGISMVDEPARSHTTSRPT